MCCGDMTNLWETLESQLQQSALSLDLPARSTSQAPEFHPDCAELDCKMVKWDQWGVTAEPRDPGHIRQLQRKASSILDQSPYRLFIGFQLLPPRGRNKTVWSLLQAQLQTNCTYLLFLPVLLSVILFRRRRRLEHVGSQIAFAPESPGNLV